MPVNNLWRLTACGAAGRTLVSVSRAAPSQQVCIWGTVRSARYEDSAAGAALRARLWHVCWIGGVELAAEQRTCTEELTQVKATTPAPIGNDPDLLTQLPQLPLALAAPSEALQRSLCDAFHLQVRYHRPRHEVTIRITIRADALPGLARLVKEAAGQPGITTGNGEPNDARSHVLSASG
jgi:hypothetical protein